MDDEPVTVSNEEKLSMTDGQLEERLQHAEAGARHATLCDVVETLKRRAGVLFAGGQDGLAKEVRRLATDLDVQRAEAEKSLDLFIARASSAALDRAYRNGEVNGSGPRR